VKHPILPRGKELGLPLVSGVLLTLSFPPFHLLIPPFVALVPYLVFISGCAEGAAASASVRRGSFWMGVVFYGTLLYWLFAALVYYTWLSLLGYLITVVVLSTFLAVAGWAIHRVRIRHNIPFWVSVPIFWTTAEWLRAHLGDLAFPWLGLGHSLTGFPALIGFADIGGARGVTVWLAAINGLMAEWWLEGWRIRWRRWSLTLAALIVVPVGYSLARWQTLETRSAARVLVVQPNIPEDLKLERDVAEDSSRTALDNLTRTGLKDSSPVELIVWPETALPDYFRMAGEWMRWSAGLARAHDAAILFGALDFERYDDEDYDTYNAALLLNRRGSPVGVYRKHYLVPIVERVPFVPVPWLRDLRTKLRGRQAPLVGDLGAFLRYFGGFGRGGEEPVMSIDGAGFGVLICYESIFPQLSRTYRRQGADFLVNITNDAWFGRERPIWSRTSALTQHPSHLVMRAIENRIGVARSANTGISLFVDPYGRRHAATPLFQPAVRIATVETTDGLTLYTRLGDWPGSLGAASAVLLLVSSWWGGRRKKVVAAPPS
jgi:apolipoprotein N-acyltransferase